MARVGEILHLTIGDIDFTNCLIRLRGKGNKERIVPVDFETLRVIKEYISERSLDEKGGNLFTCKPGKPLGIRSIQKDIQTVKEKFGFPKSRKLTPHIFRHTGATHLRQAGMDISELQELLGHSSPNTTMIYAKNDISKIQKEYRDKHPLIKF